MSTKVYTEQGTTEQGTTEQLAAAVEVRSSSPLQRMFGVIAAFAMVIGAGAVVGGIFGATYTYQQAAAENITTPADAALAEVPVRGPLSMWAQQDIITRHQLDRTEGLRFAEMERMVPAVDEAGAPVVGEDGEPVMVPNTARESWVTATTLTTALGLGMLAYGLSAFAIVVGLTLIGLGFTTYKLRGAAAVLA